MEPGVPFALLGAVQLLLVAAWSGLAGAAITLRRGPVAMVLVVAGSLVLAAVEVRTALHFGAVRSDDLALARAAGALLLGAGLYSGAVSRRAPMALPVGMAGVVVPLAAAPAPAVLAGACTFAAAIGSVRARRDLAGLLLGAGIGLSAAALLISPPADHEFKAAMAVLVLRGLSAVAVLTALVVLARSSLLAKVVAAILAGVLAMALAAVGVVGTNVVSSYQRQANSLVVEGTEQRQAGLNRVADAAHVFAPIAARACLIGQCAAALQQFVSGTSTDDFVLQVTKSGQVRGLGGRAPLSQSELLGLGRDPAVTSVFASAVPLNDVPTQIVRLVGSPPMLAIIAIALDNPRRPTSAVIYGVRLDNRYAATDPDNVGTYGLSFLVEGRVVASNLSLRQRATIEAIALRAGVTHGVPDNGTTVAAEGSQPTVHFAAVTGQDDVPLGIIAVSRDASASLEAQRSALTSLFLTALLAVAAVVGVALLVGRRTVDPVRRLTAAARRVSAGDLTASAGVRGNDEVATLSRTFDTMTGSLVQLTGDLRSAAARLQTVLASMSDGLVATDADARVTSINPAALAMVGLTEAQALGRPLGDVVDVRDPAGSALAVPTLRLLDAPGEVHRAGAPDTIAVRVAIAPLEGGEGVVLVLRDMTRDREVERMKTEFLSNVSHELRTPLTPIRGYAEILVAKPDLDPKKVSTFATTIRDESLRMGRVVDLLVDVAAIEAGRVTVALKPVSVKELLDRRLAEWKARAPERAADLRRRVAAGLPPVLVDALWVGKALDELVDNAVKYTPVGTPITLTAAAHDGAVRVSVRDAGPGIAENDQGGLFTSFEQVDGSATRRVGGLGLGLSFVRRLAEQAGFPLSFTSTVGKGSEFSLDLPISPEPLPKPRRGSRGGRRQAPVPGRGR